jgi:hypothetical protein
LIESIESMGVSVPIAQIDRNRNNRMRAPCPLGSTCQFPIFPYNNARVCRLLALQQACSIHSVDWR